MDNIYINPITYSTYHELSNPIGMHHVADGLRLASNIFHLQKPMYEFVIGADILPILADMYSAVFSNAGCLVTVHQLAVQSNKVSFFNHIINSKLCKSERGTCISTYWVPEDGSNSICTCTSRTHVGIVKMFFEFSIEVLHSHAVGGQTCVKHIIAVVDWYRIMLTEMHLVQKLKFGKSHIYQQECIHVFQLLESVI